MANLNEKINVEMENITVVLGELEKVKDKSNKTKLELAGMATYLNYFQAYTNSKNRNMA
ncbi:MAG: hypothetical protein AB1414_20980 [bacterium]